MMKKERKEHKILKSFVEKKILYNGIFVTEIPIGIKNIKSMPQIKKYISNYQSTFSSEEKAYRLFEGTLSKKIDVIYIYPTEDLNDIKAVADKLGGILRNMKLKSKKNLLERLKGKRVWILEVKERLNEEAIGQILRDEYHFTQDNPEIIIEGKGIVCHLTDELLEPVCNNLKIRIFRI